MAKSRFTIVFEKLSDAAGDDQLTAEAEEIRKETEEIAELKKIVAELESRDDATYTSS